MKISFHTHYVYIDGYNQRQIITNDVKDVEELGTLYIAGRIVKWCSCLGKQSGSSSNGLT